MFWRHDIGKKNGWPIGHPDAGQRSTIVYFLTVSCQRHGKDGPMAYLKDLPTRLPTMTNCEDRRVHSPRMWQPAKT